MNVFPQKRYVLCLIVAACGCSGLSKDRYADTVDRPGTAKLAATGTDSAAFPFDSPVQTVSHESGSAGRFQTTSSGLKFRILKEGHGRRPNRNSTVTCHYRGWLDDGTEFDSSAKRGAQTFALSDVVEGWTEGLQLIQEGGKIELEIPYELGYGEAGKGPIPAKATLHFEVELLKVRS